MKSALERLGFGPCFAMSDMLEHDEQIAFWHRAAAGQAVNWQDFYAGHRSSVNLPGSRFWREITGAFPEAKVILTVRDPDRWYDSARHSIYRAATAPPGPDTDSAFERLLAMTRALVWDGIFDGRFADREHALRVFREHNDAVRQGIDARRLLVFDVAEGWERLCGFLGVPVPDEPFPHRNGRRDVAAAVRRYRGTPPQES